MANKIEINLFLDHLSKFFLANMAVSNQILLLKNYQKRTKNVIFLPFYPVLADRYNSEPSAVVL